MAEKDITEKILESYNDVFADIVNVLLFSGRTVVAADELEDQAPRSYYKADGKIREIERDVAKRWKRGNIRLACLGLENQTHSDPDMPLRVIGYDGAAYRAQLLAGGSSDNRFPVITLVLYFGHKKRWGQPLSLKERLKIPPEFDRYVSDYRINLFEIAYLPRETVARFQSDFRVVADYFVQKREIGDYIPDPRRLLHVQETLQLLSAMTNDRRFEEAYSNDEKGGLCNMCDVLDRIELKGRLEGLLEGRQKGLLEGRQKGLLEGRQKGLLEGRQKGLLEGRQEGELKAKRDIALSLASMGLPAEKIAAAVGVSIDLIRQWLASGHDVI